MQTLKFIKVVYEKNGIRIQLIPIGERNAENMPLLRVYAYRKKNNGWEFIENSSYCTSLTIFHKKSEIQSFIEAVYKKIEKNVLINILI
ncbi:MAG: hypothetical protein HWN66_05675 [Candidatus Helarchaeota archaeon]|nr:hypothetical protein [Candidatus Helarchaeota archaeon]